MSVADGKERSAVSAIPVSVAVQALIAYSYIFLTWDPRHSRTTSSCGAYASGRDTLYGTASDRMWRTLSTKPRKELGLWIHTNNQLAARLGIGHRATCEYICNDALHT